MQKTKLQEKQEAKNCFQCVLCKKKSAASKRNILSQLHMIVKKLMHPTQYVRVIGGVIRSL